MREEKFFEKRKKFFQKRKVYQKRKIEILLKMKGGILRKSKTEDLRKMRGEIQFFEKEKGHICTKKEKFLVKRLKN